MSWYLKNRLSGSCPAALVFKFHFPIQRCKTGSEGGLGFRQSIVSNIGKNKYQKKYFNSEKISKHQNCSSKPRKYMLEAVKQDQHLVSFSYKNAPYNSEIFYIKAHHFVVFTFFEKFCFFKNMLVQYIINLDDSRWLEEIHFCTRMHSPKKIVCLQLRRNGNLITWKHKQM